LCQWGSLATKTESSVKSPKTPKNPKISTNPTKFKLTRNDMEGKKKKRTRVLETKGETVLEPFTDAEVSISSILLIR
jgi:hypothetical protein